MDNYGSNIKFALRNYTKILFSYCGIYFSKQPAKYDQLIEEIRKSLLINSSYVFHIGAHYGQEASYYEELNLEVFWVEASLIPFNVLKKNLKKFKNQKAFKALLGDKNGLKVEFHNASNDASSSIFRFGKDHNYKNLTMISSQEIDMVRMDKLFSYKTLKRFSYWCIDVQGAELLVLKGAGKLIRIPNVIEIEVSTREEYAGAPSFEDLDVFLQDHGFIPLWVPRINSHENIIYIRLNKPKMRYTRGR